MQKPFRITFIAAIAAAVAFAFLMNSSGGKVYAEPCPGHEINCTAKACESLHYWILFPGPNGTEVYKEVYAERVPNGPNLKIYFPNGSDPENDAEQGEGYCGISYAGYDDAECLTPDFEWGELPRFCANQEDQ